MGKKLLFYGIIGMFVQNNYLHLQWLLW